MTGAARSPVAGRALTLIDRWRAVRADRRRLEQDVAALAEEERRILDRLALMLDTGDDYHVTAQAPNVPTPTTSAGEKQRLSIWLLGPFNVQFGDRFVDMPSGEQTASVFRFLAAQDRPGIHKDELAARFWPVADTKTARRNLHQVIYTIRRHLARFGAEEQLTFRSDHYCLGSGDRHRDVDELVRLSHRLRAARRNNSAEESLALATEIDRLYAGPYLVDHPYDEWAEAPRQRYRCIRREATGLLIDFAADDGDWLRIVELTERLLLDDPGDEHAARHLMLAHAALGQHQLAAATYESQKRYLAEHLGVDPTPETETIARELSIR